ncbi:hypothetical protein E2C01_091191 [Portunus trituberculatus]|uniref:Uncharacterized protein n=1 Tax=Portunus trituberculatus TaxID=210409 RepID=A0A5B7JDC4_PORTR|nr:hypothetical protein [Portunus trituberculatus]
MRSNENQDKPRVVNEALNEPENEPNEAQVKSRSFTNFNFTVHNSSYLRSPPLRVVAGDLGRGRRGLVNQFLLVVQWNIDPAPDSCSLRLALLTVDRGGRLGGGGVRERGKSGGEEAERMMGRKRGWEKVEGGEREMGKRMKDWTGETE